MEKLKQIWHKFVTDILPMVWGVLWIITITAVSFGVTFWSIRWVLRMLGVLV